MTANHERGKPTTKSTPQEGVVTKDTKRNTGEQGSGNRGMAVAGVAGLVVAMLLLLLATCGPPKPPIVTILTTTDESRAQLPAVIWAQTDEDNFDCEGADAGIWQCDPDYGPVGGITGFEQITWEMLNPSNGTYDWDIIKDYADKAKSIHIQLDDGTWIDKPVAIRIMLTEATGASPVIGQDFTPDWVYALAGVSSQAEWGTGAKCVTGTVWYYPQYDNATWRTHYATFVTALGAEFDSNPNYTNIAFFLPCLGASCESYSFYNEAFGGSDCDVPAANGGMSQSFIEFAITTWNAAFPNKPHFFELTQNETNQTLPRSLTNKTSGIKCNGWQPPNYIEAEIKHAGYWDGGFSGFSIGTTAQYGTPAYQIFPTGGEPGGKGTNVLGGMYWMIMHGLADHFWMIDLQFDMMRKTVSEDGLTGFDTLKFARRYLNRTVDDAPGVWWVGFDSLVNDSDPAYCWGNPQTCIRAHRGGQAANDNLEYYLYEKRSIAGSRTAVISSTTEMQSWISGAHPYSSFMPVEGESGPAGLNRRTQGVGNPYISFDIDNAYPPAEMYPIDDTGDSGNVTWYITVTYADTGYDEWTLDYYDYANALQSATGCAKTNSMKWKNCPFVLTDAMFDADTTSETFLGGADFRINSQSDGDELIHRILVEPVIAEGPVPTPDQTATFVAGLTRTAIYTGTATAEAAARATQFVYMTQTKAAANATELAAAQQTATAGAIATKTATWAPTVPANTATIAWQQTATAAPIATATTRAEQTATASAVYATVTAAWQQTATAAWSGNATATMAAYQTAVAHIEETAIAAQLTSTPLAAQTATKAAQQTATAAAAPPTPTRTPTPTPTGVCPDSVKLYGTHVWGPGTYTISCRIGVMEGAKLTLLPGTELQFEPGTRMDVYGEFYALGDASTPITFTSSVSDTVGSWGGIYFGWKSVGEIEYGTVLYGLGLQDESSYGAYIHYTNVMTNSYGLATAANTTVISSTLAYNDIGVLMKSQAYPDIQYSNIVTSTLYNVWNDQPLDVTIPYCWWGAASPTGADIWDGADDPRLGIVTRSDSAAGWISW